MSSSSSTVLRALLRLEPFAYALSLPKFASGWSCRPCPGKYWNTSSEPGKETRAP